MRRAVLFADKLTSLNPNIICEYKHTSNTKPYSTHFTYQDNINKVLDIEYRPVNHRSFPEE